MKKFRTLAGLAALIMTLSFAFALPVSFCAMAAEADDEPAIVAADRDYDTEYGNKDEDYSIVETAKSSKSSSGSHSIVKAILVAFGVSTVGTIIWVIVIVNGYKNNGKTEPYPYNKKAPLELTEASEELINTEVTKRKIERNNN